MIKFKKTYRFALRTSFFITLILALIMSVFLWSIDMFYVAYILGYIVLSYAVCFFIIQYRVEKFIYKRVNKIYDDLTLLESKSFSNKGRVTTDMATLTKEIDKYARDKKLEIETLKVREEYRKEFLGNVSHELKTPLFTVQGYILTLLNGAMQDEKIAKKYLERADAGVERLIYIVKDLDMITRLEVGDLSLNIEKFDVIELINSVFELFEMKASKKNISLNFDRDYGGPIYVLADRERIQQVLTNLLVNSIKYGRDEGTTEVSVDELVKNKIIVRVTDNGGGIEEKHIGRLFERFYRVDKTGNRKVGGSGLGLSIVKHIIEAHDERIYVESEIGVGSEFSFTLEKVQ